jgi:hypothetical protein
VAAAADLEVDEGAEEDVAAEALGEAAAAYHVSTPLCPLHAPCLVAVVVNVPSLHLPVTPAGAPEGAWAIREQGSRIIPTTAAANSFDFMGYHPFCSSNLSSSLSSLERVMPAHHILKHAECIVHE